MKTLVIAPQPFFSPRGTPFSVYYRTLISSELGLKIDFLTYGEGQDVDIPNVNIIRIPRFKFLGNVKIGPSPLKLFLDIFIIFKTIGLLIKNKYDLVHAHEEAIFFARYLKPIFKYKLIYDMHSSLPQQLTNFNFTTSKTLINIFKKLEDSCLRSADGVITICLDLYNYVNTIIENKDKHFLIENSIFDKVKLKANSNHQKINEDETPIHLPEDKKIIVYAGTLEKYQGIDILVKSFSEMHKKNENTILIIVGGNNSQVEEYKKLGSELGIEKEIIFTGRVSQILAKHYTSLADVLVSPRSNGTNTPLKIYEQIASAKPLVATNIYSHTQVLTEDVAFLVEPKPADMAEGLLAAVNSNGIAKEKTENARKLYEEKYSRKIYTQKLKSLLESLS